MRLTFFGALLATTALLVTACTGSGTGPSGGSASADRLRIAVPRDVGPLNIFVGAPEPLAELVYDKLVAPSPYVAQPQPWLATGVRQVDPSTWDVDLRSDVAWHDGVPFTADDVIFTFGYMKAAPTGRWTHHVSDVPTVDTVTAVAANTVRLHCAAARIRSVW